MSHVLTGIAIWSKHYILPGPGIYSKYYCIIEIVTQCLVICLYYLLSIPVNG
jgi:hypothetical protein